MSPLNISPGLVEHNFTVRLFNRTPGLGGNWFYSEEVPVREPYPDEPLGKQKWVPDHLPATQYYQEGDGGLSLDERWREHWLPLITELPDVPYLPDHPWVIPAHTIQAHVRAYTSLHKLNVND
ncbi:hypothetical protein ARMSODRAFT_1019896 [Armillaria solidipes]|uniref:Uncharacterized protein n=1 Tax=Armillaria solidipes TaxID=1076256 RepID=A0A2H3BUS4_9AGAR|nr:hypothetical protein ARMSODRAFT_1019896 [Armillaria solidipes]